MESYLNSMCHCVMRMLCFLRCFVLPAKIRSLPFYYNCILCIWLYVHCVWNAFGFDVGFCFFPAKGRSYHLLLNDYFCILCICAFVVVIYALVLAVGFVSSRAKGGARGSYNLLLTTIFCYSDYMCMCVVRMFGFAVCFFPAKAGPYQFIINLYSL